MALKPARLQWAENDTIENPDFGDVYFQRGQGMAEKRHVFLEGNRLPVRFAAPPGDIFHIAELGFGSGLNFLLTAQLWRAVAPPQARLVYVAVEKHPILKEDLVRLYAAWPELAEDAAAVLAQYPPLIEGFHHIHAADGRVRLMLAFGDVADVLPEVSGAFDAWYLDGFTPARNPDMWSENLYPLIAARTKPGGTAATFSVAGHMRRGLKAAGFVVKKAKGFGVKWSMTAATFPGAPAMTQEKKNVTILGAGLAGCSAAYAFARRGYNVTVRDRAASCASGASGNPAGILYPKMTVDESPMGRFHAHGFCYTRALAASLRLPSWTACGVAHLDMNAEDAARTKNLMEKNEYPAEYARITPVAEVTGTDIAQSALYQPMAGFLSPPELCAALLNHPRITKIYDDAATALPEDGITVIALGMDSTQFDATAWLPLQSLRGQITYVAATESSARLKTVVCHDGYIMPARNGVHCIGATFQKEPPAALELRDADHAENIQKLHDNLPAFKTCTEVKGGRIGYRATTPDKLPLAGPCPDVESFKATHAGLRQGRADGGDAAYVRDVYILTGFGAHGLSGAPLGGEIVAALAAGDVLPVPQSLLPHVLPERFILRDLKRRRI